MSDETRLKTLLRRLDSRNETVRNAAIAEAHRLPFDSFQRLVEIESRGFRRSSRRRRALGASLLAIWLVMQGLTWLQIVDEHKASLHPNVFGDVVFPCSGFVIWSAFFTGVVFHVWRYGVKATRARESLVEAVQKLPEGERLLLLLTLFQTKSKTVRSSLRYMLRLELMQLRASDAERLTSDQKAALATILDRPYEDGDLTLAVLKALEQVGGEEAVPAVKKLADKAGKPGKYASIHYAAEECLPYLQNHAQERRASQSLLRPTRVEAAPASHLLRPVSAWNGGTSGKRLLRPVSTREVPQTMPHEAPITNPGAQARANAGTPKSYLEQEHSEQPPTTLLAGTKQ